MKKALVIVLVIVLLAMAVVPAIAKTKAPKGSPYTLQGTIKSISGLNVEIKSVCNGTGYAKGKSGTVTVAAKSVSSLTTGEMVIAKGKYVKGVWKANTVKQTSKTCK